MGQVPSASMTIRLTEEFGVHLGGCGLGIFAGFAGFGILYGSLGGGVPMDW